MPVTTVLTTSLLDQIKTKAFHLGFDHCAATPARIADHDQEAYLSWCANGFAADMAYMTREPDKRLHIQKAFPETKTVLTLGVSYYQGPVPDKPGKDYGRVARYAWGLDYHPLLWNRLQDLIGQIQDLVGAGIQPIPATDSKPILERALARSASLGFVGKNTVLIVPRGSGHRGLGSPRFHVGSWVFLAEVLLNIPFESEPPPEAVKGCGQCTKCLDHCPTDAFEKPYRLKADRCIAYLTIENKGWIPRPVRSEIGDWLFGCDVCQDVCPFNARAFETRWPEFMAVKGAGPWVSLREIFSLPGQAAFKQKWGHTPFARAKRRGLVRNACVVAGNSKDESLRGYLEALLSDPEPIIRGHALWALWRTGSSKKTRTQAERLVRQDPDSLVRMEGEAILGS